MLTLRSYGQLSDFGFDSKWNQGVLVLDDDRQLNGFIQHNFELGLVKFKPTAQSTEQSFQEKNISLLEYVDRETSRKRRFLKFNVNSVKAPIEIRESVFEVIMELDEIALLSKIYPVIPQLENYSFDPNGFSGVKKVVGYEQYQSFFLVNLNGKADCLLIIREFEKKNKKKSIKLKVYYDKHILEKYTGAKWPQVKTYMKDKRITIENKADVLSVLEYYESLK